MSRNKNEEDERDEIALCVPSSLLLYTHNGREKLCWFPTRRRKVESVVIHCVDCRTRKRENSSRRKKACLMVLLCILGMWIHHPATHVRYWMNSERYTHYDMNEPLNSIHIWTGRRWIKFIYNFLNKICFAIESSVFYRAAYAGGSAVNGCHSWFSSSSILPFFRFPGQFMKWGSSSLTRA